MSFFDLAIPLISFSKMFAADLCVTILMTAEGSLHNDVDMNNVKLRDVDSICICQLLLQNKYKYYSKTKCQQ